MKESCSIFPEIPCLILLRHTKTEAAFMKLDELRYNVYPKYCRQAWISKPFVTEKMLGFSYIRRASQIQVLCLQRTLDLLKIHQPTSVHNSSRMHVFQSGCQLYKIFPSKNQQTQRNIYTVENTRESTWTDLFEFLKKKMIKLTKSHQLLNVMAFGGVPYTCAFPLKSILDLF